MTPMLQSKEDRLPIELPTNSKKFEYPGAEPGFFFLSQGGSNLQRGGGGVDLLILADS